MRGAAQQRADAHQRTGLHQESPATRASHPPQILLGVQTGQVGFPAAAPAAARQTGRHPQGPSHCPGVQGHRLCAGLRFPRQTGRHPQGPSHCPGVQGHHLCAGLRVPAWAGGMLFRDQCWQQRWTPARSYPLEAVAAAPSFHQCQRRHCCGGRWRHCWLHMQHHPLCLMALSCPIGLSADVVTGACHLQQYGAVRCLHVLHAPFSSANAVACLCWCQKAIPVDAALTSVLFGKRTCDETLPPLSGLLSMFPCREGHCCQQLGAAMLPRVATITWH